MSTRQRRRNSWFIGAAIILGAAFLMSFLVMPEYMVYFYTPREALLKASELSKRDIKVGGMVEAGSMKWNAQDLLLTFTLTDLSDVKIMVTYLGTPPDMFKENSGVVVEGRINDDGTQLKANKLMVKHSEEYKAPDDGHSVDKELIEKSIFKGVSGE